MDKSQQTVGINHQLKCYKTSAYTWQLLSQLYSQLQLWKHLPQNNGTIDDIAIHKYNDYYIAERKNFKIRSMSIASWVNEQIQMISKLYCATILINAPYPNNECTSDCNLHQLASHTIKMWTTSCMISNSHNIQNFHSNILCGTESNIRKLTPTGSQIARLASYCSQSLIKVNDIPQQLASQM